MKGRNPLSGVLDRLAQNARARLYDFLQRHVFAAPAAARWQDADDWPDEPFPNDTAEPHERHEPSSPLPYGTDLADAYRLLDLPFGAPLADANRRWKAYLKRCHPDRFHGDPERQAEATELTQQLNAAHDLIEAAWKSAGSR